MLNKIVLPVVSFVSLFFLFQVIVHAGGCCFESVSVTRDGTAGIMPAIVEGKLLSMKYLMDKQEPKYKSNQIIRALNSQSPNVKCQAAITDEVGHFVMECASSQPGSFPIEVKPLAANDEAGSATPVTVVFVANPSQTPTPTPTTQPTSTPTPTVAAEPTATPTQSPTPSPTPDLATQQRIAELEAKVLEQEQKISFMESVISRLENLLNRIFRFSRN